MNTAAFLRDQRRYFEGSYAQFCAFGGPCVYFHRECIRAGDASFLSDRHLEMLYATLTAWGMHRMGDTDTTKTKLTDWALFRDSIREHGTALEPLRRLDMRQLSDPEYEETVSALGSCYRGLAVSVSSATIVANSKTLYHLLPGLIPPIDRQYTIRFFRDAPDKWRGPNGKFKTITLPTGPEAQFDLFRSTCRKVKGLADRIDSSFLDHELSDHEVRPPKAIDNAIVNFVRLNAGADVPAA